MSLHITYAQDDDGGLQLYFSSPKKERLDDKFIVDFGEVSTGVVVENFDDTIGWNNSLEKLYLDEPQRILTSSQPKKYKPCIFEINPNANTCEFRVFVSSEQNNFDELIFSCQTTKREIIEQLYAKLIAFAKSPAFKKSCKARHKVLLSYTNPTLENYLKDEFALRTSVAKCPHCGQKIPVHTLCDMLDKAYALIKQNTKFMNFLEQIGENINTIGIMQNHQRTAQTNDKYHHQDYRVVKECDENGIFICFSEDFERIEGVELERDFFRLEYQNFGFGAVRCQKMRDELSYDEKIALVKQFFACFWSDDSALCEYMGDGKCVFALKAGKSWKESYDTFARFTLHQLKDEHHKQNGKLNYIHLQLIKPEPINAFNSLWLNQKVIMVMADYTSFLSFDGCDFTSFDGLKACQHLVKSELESDFKAWILEFDEFFLSNTADLDWEEFNERGLALARRLQDEIKADYIVLYARSHDEIVGSADEQGELMEFDERKLSLRVKADKDGTGVWHLQKPLQYHANEPCELSTLGISQDLQNKLTRWQGKFRTQNSPQARKEQHKEGFKLAQRLKNELQDRAYVEFEGAHRCILCERKP